MDPEESEVVGDVKVEMDLDYLVSMNRKQSSIIESLQDQAGVYRSEIEMLKGLILSAMKGGGE